MVDVRLNKYVIKLLHHFYHFKIFNARFVQRKMLEKLDNTVFQKNCIDLDYRDSEIFTTFDHDIGFNPKKAGEVNLSPLFFSKMFFSRHRVKPYPFVTFNFIISHMFSKNFIEIPQISRKL